MKNQILTGAIAIVFGTAVAAHDGVQNEAVKVRMQLMDGIKNNMGVIGGMAKGTIQFDSEKAEAARAALEEAADEIPAVFEANETDPKSEALPSVWESWDNFISGAEDLSMAAGVMDVSSLDTLRAGIGNVGATCSSCHKSFRMKK